MGSTTSTSTLKLISVNPWNYIVPTQAVAIFEHRLNGFFNQHEPSPGGLNQGPQLA
jgi:hypothetical protein